MRGQVDVFVPDAMTFTEFDGMEFVAVQPSWAHVQRGELANICRLDDLMVSNRERLYQQVCSALFNLEVERPQDTLEQKKLVSFDVIQMAADGKCGWRALLAAIDVMSFLAIPRTSLSIFGVRIDGASKEKID